MQKSHFLNCLPWLSNLSDSAWSDASATDNADSLLLFRGSCAFYSASEKCVFIEEGKESDSYAVQMLLVHFPMDKRYRLFLRFENAYSFVLDESKVAVMRMVNSKIGLNSPSLMFAFKPCVSMHMYTSGNTDSEELRLVGGRLIVAFHNARFSDKVGFGSEDSESWGPVTVYFENSDNFSGDEINIEELEELELEVETLYNMYIQSRKLAQSASSHIDSSAQIHNDLFNHHRTQSIGLLGVANRRFHQFDSLKEIIEKLDSHKRRGASRLNSGESVEDLRRMVHIQTRIECTFTKANILATSIFL